MASNTIALDASVLPDLPNQPTKCLFLKQSFGKNVVWCLFQSTWFQKWVWLHYDEIHDKVYCYTCARGFKEKKVKGSSADAAFVSMYVQQLHR